MDYLKEFVSKIQNLDRTKNLATVFRDFLFLSTCALAQPFYRSDEIEQRYLKTVNEYTKEQASKFSELLALLVSALEEDYQDFLGKLFMNLDFGNSAIGQFLTPYHVSKMMAEINFIDMQESIKDKDIITLSEPCSGAGGMVIAFAQTMKDKGINYQKQLFVEAIDIDEMCFMMTYIQLSLYGIPARVIQGDTLTLKFQRELYTPFYFISNIGYKLKNKPKEEIKAIPSFKKATQLSLFDLATG